MVDTTYSNIICSIGSKIISLSSKFFLQGSWSYLLSLFFIYFVCLTLLILCWIFFSSIIKFSSYPKRKREKKEEINVKMSSDESCKAELISITFNILPCAILKMPNPLTQIHIIDSWTFHMYSKIYVDLYLNDSRACHLKYTERSPSSRISACKKFAPWCGLANYLKILDARSL